MLNSTYRELLENNDFMLDFKAAFGIVRFKMSINKSLDKWDDNGIYKISPNEVSFIEDIIKHEIINPILIKYDRSIDLSKIDRTYILFEDLNKELFVISYEKGEYVNRPYDTLDDKRDRDLLIQKLEAK